jgi:hypothetical protein
MVAMVLAVLIGRTAPSFGQPPCPPAPPPYQSLRYQEEYAFLHNPACRTDLWDPVKYVSLAGREDVYLSLGGEVRLQYEYFRHADWGEGPQDPNGYLLPRLMLHTDWHLGPYVRLFGQLKSGFAIGRTGGPRPPDEDQLDLHQAFLDVRGPLGEASALTLRAGRQELAYGASRLVDAREGPNIRRSFEGVVQGREALRLVQLHRFHHCHGGPEHRHWTRRRPGMAEPPGDDAGHRVRHRRSGVLQG